MKHIHFMGIGGSGTNAAAGIAHNLGYEVTGCDVKESEYLVDLVSLNIPVMYGHDSHHLLGTELLCVSPALFDSKEGAVEISYARENGIPVKTWQQFMGEDLQNNKKVIAIAGTKGKTTTTALTGHVLEQANFDPIVAVGGRVVNWERNYRVGEGSFFVCEADEFNNNFHWYSSDIAVITNLEMDHPEFFSSYEEYLQAFIIFVTNIKPSGHLILCTDSEGCIDLLKKLNPEIRSRIKIFGYGIVQPSDFIVQMLQNFELISATPTQIPSLVGSHNILNVASVRLVAELLGIDATRFESLISAFRGVDRRFEMVCLKNDIAVYFDYAHNPMSVRATLKTAREMYPEGRLWAVLQPHLYSRTKMFLNEFALALGGADKVIITDIYPSREADKPISKEVHSMDLVKKTKELNPSMEPLYLGDLEETAQYLMQHLRPGDVVLNMGAGNNGIISDALCQTLK